MIKRYKGLELTFVLSVQELLCSMLVPQLIYLGKRARRCFLGQQTQNEEGELWSRGYMDLEVTLVPSVQELMN